MGYGCLQPYYNQLGVPQNITKADRIRPAWKPTLIAHLDDVATVFLHIVYELCFVRFQFA